MTSRAVLPGTLILLLVLVGLASLRGAFLALALPLLVYVLYALWQGPEALDLEVRRELSAERVSPQEPVHVRVSIHNRGAALDELAVQDGLPAGLAVSGGSHHHLISLPRGGSFSFEYDVRGQRGSYPFESMHLEAGEALGMLRVAQQKRLPGHLLVLPGIRRIRDVPIRPRRTRVYAGAIPARVGGTGVEFFGVRGYEAGDTPRRINWRISARHPEALFSNEFQQERVADVAIVLDGRERANLFPAGHSLFEHSVSAAGALADAFLTHGNRVGLLVYSQYLQWTVPGYGKLQRERILHALAAASPGASQIFAGLQYLPTRVFPSESQIVLISPLLEDDYTTLIQLRARGYQVMLIIPDPVSFEQSCLAGQAHRLPPQDVELAARVVRMERSLMLARLQRAGLQLVEWNVARPLDQAMRQLAGRQALGGPRR